MKSMTGFGISKILKDNIEVRVEIKSINGRFFDLKTYLPREISFYEHLIRKMVSSRLNRGTIELRLYIDDQREPNIVLNELKFKKYHEIIKNALESVGSKQEIPLSMLFSEYEIIETKNNLDEDDDTKSIINNAINSALDNLEISLLAEGNEIKAVMHESIVKIGEALSFVKEQIQPYKEELFENMKKRIDEIIKAFKIDTLEQRLVQELALYIDRYDVQEEITRLESHIKMFNQYLDADGEVGKNLVFVLQEMQREANTLGSKFSTNNTFKHIIVIKEEIEKCREIAQNVA